MKPYYTDDLVELHHGDCLDVMRQMPDASVHAVVTDPPAGIGFMNRTWDGHKGGREQWSAWLAEVMAEALRICKPGAHALVWALPRTSHWTACGLEDAGWQIRDCITHLFGSGFPKSHNLTGEWQGWGTALKPGSEHWWLVRKPLAGTVAQNVLTHGTGALNVDGCRIATDEPLAAHHGTNGAAGVTYGQRAAYVPGSANPENTHTKGRWPTNVVLDDTAAAELDRQSGIQRDGVAVNRNRGNERPSTVAGVPSRVIHEDQGYGGEGGSSRFFPTFRYEAKAPTEERPRAGGVAHPTVKPLDLMRWLVRLVTPPGGTVLDPFAGSGTTAEACVIEGFRCVTIEREADYLPLILARLTKPIEPVLDLGVLG